MSDLAAPRGEATISVPGPQYSRIEISRSALRRNLSLLRSLVGEGCRLSSVVKGNAYGHGISTVVPLAEEWGVRHFSVYQAQEAYEVRRASNAGSDVLVLGFQAPDELEWSVRHGVTFSVLDLAGLRAAMEAAGRVGRAAVVHLDLETGMNRTGLDGDDLESAIRHLRERPDLLQLDGVGTHFAGAESEGNHVRIQRQIERFRGGLDQLAAYGLRPRLRHTCGSAATFAYPESHENLVRVGIAQYGLWPSQETRMRHLIERGRERSNRDPLRRVMRWSTRIASVKEVGPAEFVGYGRSYLTTRPQKIACLPIGYGQGFPRSLGNLGFVLVRGMRAPVVGVVNMNLTTIDVTSIPDVAPGDEAVLIGKQGRKEITVGWFGDLSQMLNYEVLVRIPPDVPRHVVS